MVISFLHISLMISPENVNLDKSKLKKLTNFKHKFLHIYIFGVKHFIERTFMVP